MRFIEIELESVKITKKNPVKFSIQTGVQKNFDIIDIYVYSRNEIPFQILKIQEIISKSILCDYDSIIINVLYKNTLLCSRVVRIEDREVKNPLLNQ